MTSLQKKQKIKKVKEAYLSNRQRKLIFIKAEQEKERQKQLILNELKRKEELARLKQEEEDFIRILNFKK